MTHWNHIPETVGEPDSNNLLAVLWREVPDRPTLFEFFLNGRLDQRLEPLSEFDAGNPFASQRHVMNAYHRAGYDFTNVIIPGFEFPSERTAGTQTISINEGGLIRDWDTYESYPWPDPKVGAYEILDVLAHELPDGMKMIGYGPNGVL